MSQQPSTAAGADPERSPSTETSTSASTTSDPRPTDLSDDGTADEAPLDESRETATNLTSQEPDTVEPAPPIRSPLDDGGGATSLPPLDVEPLPPPTSAKAPTPKPLGTTSIVPTGDDAAAWVLPGALLGILGTVGTMKLRHRGDQAEASDDEASPAGSSGVSDEEDGAEETDPVIPPVAGPEGLLLLAQDAIDRRELEDAIAWLETAIAAAPNLQAAHFCLGLCLDELGRLEQAADTLGHACELEPGDPLAAYQHASVLARLGQTPSALDELERLTRQHAWIADQMREDEDLACLGDHPRFLALTGEL